MPQYTSTSLSRLYLTKLHKKENRLKTLQHAKSILIKNVDRTFSTSLKKLVDWKKDQSTQINKRFKNQFDKITVEIVAERFEYASKLLNTSASESDTEKDGAENLLLLRNGDNSKPEMDVDEKLVKKERTQATVTSSVKVTTSHPDLEPLRLKIPIASLPSMEPQWDLHGKVTCNICGKQYSPSYIKIHHETHLNLRCSDCHKLFATETDLAQHNQKHHTDVDPFEPFPCQGCFKTFSTYRERRDHIRDEHRNKPLKCTRCLKSFPNKSTLKVHFRSHTGEKPFKCEECPKSFSSREYLKVHMRAHTGEKPFKCDICSKGFASKLGLKSHEQSNSHRRRLILANFAEK